MSDLSIFLLFKNPSLVTQLIVMNILNKTITVYVTNAISVTKNNLYGNPKEKKTYILGVPASLGLSVNEKNIIRSPSWPPL